MFRSNKRRYRSYTVGNSRVLSERTPKHMMKKKNKSKESFGFVKNYVEPVVHHGAYMVMQKREPHIITGADTYQGRRIDQQDAFYVTKSVELSPFRLRRTFAVVCDGMGGLEAGDRASITAVEMMKFAFGRLPSKRVDIPHFFHDMLENIDWEINHWTDLLTDKGSGTTLISVIIENRRLYWASVGDSTIFIVQDGEIKRITREHNYRMCLNELVSDGTITRQQADAEPQQDALVSYLGMGGIAYMDIPSKPYVMKKGDVLLLCTDGITNTLTDEEILEIVNENIDDVYGCCKVITRSVEEKGREVQDNATVVMIQYVE